MGCHEPAERVHLGERLADEAEVAEAKVAQPAVDQLRRRARCARCEVVALDERDPESVSGGDLGDAGSDDSAADDEQVEPSRPQAVERGCSLAHRSDDTHPTRVTSRHPGPEDDDRVDEGGSRTPVSAPDPADAPSGRSRLAEAQERMRRAGDWANGHVPGAYLVNVALERERIAAAGLLAGGLAYRLFFWLLPLGLVLAAIASFWVDADQRGAADAAREFGMGGAAVQSAMDAIAEQHHARWYFLAAGIVLVVWFSMGVVRALNVAFSVAWGMRPEKLRRPVKAAVAFTGIVILLMAVTALTQFLREQLGAMGLLLTFGLLAFYLVGVLWIMEKLPHRGSDWRDLLPGALLVALGAQLIHLVVVLYLAPKIGRSSELYGTLGAATVLLLWLYLVARLVVAAAFLNAAIWEHRAGAERVELPLT